MRRLSLLLVAMLTACADPVWTTCHEPAEVFADAPGWTCEAGHVVVDSVTVTADTARVCVSWSAVDYLHGSVCGE